VATEPPFAIERDVILAARVIGATFEATRSHAHALSSRNMEGISENPGGSIERIAISGEYSGPFHRRFN